MKKSLILCGVLAAFASCKDNTKQLLKSVDGNWKVSAVTYSRQVGADSMLSPNSTYLNFQSCYKNSKNNTPGDCKLDYVTDKKNSPLSYQATDGNKSIYINAAGPINDQDYKAVYDQLAGSYEVVELSENQLIIKRDLNGYPSGFKSVQYTATK